MIFFLLLALVTLPVQGKVVRVACIGDSVTYGMTLEDRETESYPAQLQQMLGAGYQVATFGRNGATLLRQGHRPYMEQEEYQIILYEPEEQLKSTMNVFASLELKGAKYFLAAVAYEEDDEDEEEIEEEDGVFIFRICDAEESEFEVLKEDGITDYYVTTELGDRMEEVINAFQNMSDDFDLIADEDE